MRKMLVSLISIMLVAQFSLANATDPSIRQVPTRPMAPQRESTIPQLKLTPDYLYQQITSLQKQVAGLQAQVKALRSVVQVSQNGATIQATYLTIKGQTNLALTSSKKINLTAGDDLNLTSGKTLALQGGKDVTAEGAGQIKLKAPQIKLNDGTKPIALKDSPVAGGKVISGSTTVFAK